MIRAKNYITVSKFVKVMTKILWPLFFPDTVYIPVNILYTSIMSPLKFLTFEI